MKFLLRRGRRRSWLLFLALFLISRGVFLGNPWIWREYLLLSYDELDYRNRDVVRLICQQDDPSPAWLAVGSSQVSALFHHGVASRLGIAAFPMAGMSPLDYFLYRDMIFARKPGGLLLYLSELDMVPVPKLELLRSAPAQGLRWIPLIRLLAPSRGLYARGTFWHALAVAIATQACPEANYSWIARAYLQRLSQSDLALGRTPLSERPRGEVAKATEGIVAGLLGSDGLDVSFRLLESFLTDCQARGIPVVILQGNYNPRFFGPRERQLRERTRARMAELVARIPGVRTVADDAAMQLLEEDYKDAVHVLPPAGRRYTAALVKILGR